MTAPKGFRISETGAAPTPGDALQTALVLHSQGRFQEALDLLSGSGDFPAADAYTLRGDVLVDMGRLAEAIGSYYSATVEAPANLYARSRLASCLRRLGRWEQAAEAFQSVLNSDPHRDPLRLELGDCLLHLNRPEQALSCFDQCWSDAAQRQALFGKGVALQLLRRFEEAEIVYERVLVLDGKAEEVLANLIALSLDAFDLERVLRYSRRLVEINPGSALGLQGLTLVALERGEMDAAARHFSALMAKAPASVRTGRESSDDDVMEYRISPKSIERIRNVMHERVSQAAVGRQ